MGNVGRSLLDRLPADAFPLFNDPAITYTVCPQNSVTPIVGRNPYRVVLCLVAGTQLNISPDGTVSTSNPGFQLSPNSVPWILSWWVNGPLIYVPWYGFTGAQQATVTAIEIAVNPRVNLDAGQQSLFDGNPIRPPVNRISTSPGVGGLRGLYDWWIKRIGKR